MTLAVSCNLSDGVVLGVDSAFTVSMGGTTKVYDSADKLFALGTKPIGVAMYGAGEFGGRVIGNYMAEFEAKHPEVARADAELAVVAETLRAFFHERYMTIVAPALEKSKGKPFADIPETERPGLGLVIAGFSPGQYLSEVWNVLIPNHINVGSAIRVAGQGEFNSNWFALYEPIFRYWWGYDPRVVEDVANYIGTIRAPLTDPEKVGFVNAFGQRQYLFPVGMMPMPVAVEFVKFLVGLVISHHRFPPPYVPDLAIGLAIASDVLLAEQVGSFGHSNAPFASSGRLESRHGRPSLRTPGLFFRYQSTPVIEALANE